jgi:hypothetical protein
MPLFRKKPVVIEAVQLTWANWGDLCDMLAPTREQHKAIGVYVDENGKETKDCNGKIGLKIHTLEGVMLATENDWIIEGVNGEVCPCKPDIFAKTYEIAEQVFCKVCNHILPTTGICNVCPPSKQ